MRLRRFVVTLLLSLTALTFLPFKFEAYGSGLTSDLYDLLKTELQLPSNFVPFFYGAFAETPQGTLIAVNDTTTEPWRGKVYRSVDDGASWTEVLDAGALGSPPAEGIFVTNQGWIILPSGKSGDAWYVSKDDGVSWTNVPSFRVKGPLQHSWVQLDNGTLYFAPWGIDAHIWKSDDAITWTPWKNVTEIFEGCGLNVSSKWVVHAHSLTYDKYDDRWFIASGDDWEGEGTLGHVIARSEDGGVTWTFIPNHGGPTGRLVTEDCGVFFTPDGLCRDLWLFDRNNDTKDLDIARRFNLRPYGYNYAYKNGIIYVQCQSISTRHDYGVVISPDGGYTWARLKTIENTIGAILLKNGAGDYIWLFDSSDDKIYKMRALSYSEAVYLCRNNYNSQSGSTVTYEKIVGNGTDWIQFSEHGISSATLTMYGYTYENYKTNPSFETGDKTGWSITGAGGSVVTEDAYDGTYSWKSVAGSRSYLTTPTGEQQYVTVGYGACVTNSFYAISNDTVDDAFYLYVHYKNATASASYLRCLFDSATEWTRFSYGIKIPDWADRVRFFLYVLPRALTSYIDACMTEKSIEERTTAKRLDIFEPNPFFSGKLNTTNPSLEILGETYSYSGILTNGTATSTEEVTINLSGITSILNIQVSGSGLVTVRIIGTVAFETTQILIREYTNSIFEGWFYASDFTISSTNDIILMAETWANITSASLKTKRLDFAVSKASGTSTTKVYCGTMGQPISVSGATSWNYDSATKICTITATHSSIEEIMMDWTPHARGSYNLQVHVTKNGLPTNAYICIQGYENRSIFALTKFQLPYGEYTVIATCEGKTQTKTIFLSDNTCVGFNFEGPKKHGRTPWE